MKKDWKGQVYRDVLALGSWVFYFLVIGRALIQPYRPFVDQIVVAGLVMFILGFIIKKGDKYLARGLILIVFTIMFYQSFVYGVFAVGIGVLMLISSFTLYKDVKNIGIGLLLGAVGIGFGYWIPGFYL